MSEDYRILEDSELTREGDEFRKPLGSWEKTIYIGFTLEKMQSWCGAVEVRRKIRIQSPGYRYLDAGETPRSGDQLRDILKPDLWMLYTPGLLSDVQPDSSNYYRNGVHYRIFRRPIIKPDPYQLHREKLERDGREPRIQPMSTELLVFGPDLSGDEYELSSEELRRFDKSYG